MWPNKVKDGTQGFLRILNQPRSQVHRQGDAGFDSQWLLLYHHHFVLVFAQLCRHGDLCSLFSVIVDFADS